MVIDYAYCRYVNGEHTEDMTIKDIAIHLLLFICGVVSLIIVIFSIILNIWDKFKDYKPFQRRN